MLLVTILTLLAVPIGLFLYSELIGFLKVRDYRKQGIKNATYIPLPLFIMTIKKRFFSNDVLEFRKKKMVEMDHQDPFFVNNTGSRCNIFLNSNQAASEFYAKEVDVTIKMNYMPQVSFLGFFFKNGEEVQEQRAIFSKIFHYSNVVSMLPGIRDTVRKHVKQLRQRVAQAGGELKVNLKKEFSTNLFDDLTGVLLFKAADNKLTEKFEGMTVTQITQKMFSQYVQNFFKFFNRLPFVAELGLNKQASELQRLQKGLRKIVKKEYERRYNSPNQDDKCVLDIMISLNKESEKQNGKPKFTMEEIASTFELFQFAASDTSFHFSSSLITFLALAENKKYQERLSKELQTAFGANPDYSSEELSSLKELDLVFKETGRMANSAAIVVDRKVTKEFELCGYKINKGDMLKQVLVNFQPEYYKDPYKFNPDRHDTHSAQFNKVPHLRRTPSLTARGAVLGGIWAR